MEQKDLQQIKAKGISEAQTEKQIRQFETGFPFLKLEAAAAIGKGIMAPEKQEADAYVKAWEDYKASGKKIVKFVPASGAASRMFKNLFEYLDNGEETDFIKKFMAGKDKFAFGPQLAGKEGKDAVSYLLNDMNYGNLPKGLLLFHKYEDGPRTPALEHLVEGALYASSNGKVNLHFTVSHDHLELFKKHIAENLPKFETKYGVKYDVSFSEQKPSTDTVAVNPDNTLFRNSDGSLLFRPGGHGALIENLNEIDGDIIFIKNIDNVVPDRLKPETVEWKQIIAGVLVTLQKKAFEYLNILDSGKYDHAKLEEIIRFVQQDLCCRKSDIKELEDAELVIYLKKKLNRPMRVCGVVKNVGEPGGGPFLTYNQDGTVSLQILESSQIDKNNAEYMKMFTGGTHFNPVDLVCAVKDYKGNAFNLPDYVDPSTGFISSKSKNGKELRALELPGLWNGAMSDWSTVFVEVPLGTFNPVKTVNDLLREQHQ